MTKLDKIVVPILAGLALTGILLAAYDEGMPCLYIARQLVKEICGV